MSDKRLVSNVTTTTPLLHHSDKRLFSNIGTPPLPVLNLCKTDQYRRVLHFIANSGVPRLCFQAIRCTLPNCTCECFSPGKVHIRACDSCKHGWVAHALDKLGYRHIFNLGMQVEVVQPNIVFDIASLMLYGAQAAPIRLKILLDRLFSVLQHDEVLQVLQGFGWTYEDYARGYILQDQSGQVLDKWTVATREEEQVILQQFLRFGETKSIAQEIILQDTKDQQDMYIKQTTRAESEIKKFIERSNHSMHSYIRSLESRQMFGNRLPFVPVASRLMTPPTIANFSPPCSRDLRPPVVPASSSPISTSPLGRLQTMQPFDYKREQGSPTVSPSVPEKHLPGSSPSESPKNLSCTTPSPAKSMTPPFVPIKTHESKEHTPVTIATPLGTSMTLPILPPDDDQGNDAIDYSTSSKESREITSSFYSDRKIKHMRKSTTPIKRHWTPSPGFGCTFVGPNGKKRVLCTACNKTFCDKGALKIHYSAVHLKEMHKCTVDGCNMMFSSRRSRNRHSANPNPKLHMPQKRLKLPEGATVIDDGTGNKANMMVTSDSPPTMVMHPSLVPSPKLTPLDSPEMSRSNHAFYAELNAHLAMFPSPEKKLRLEDGNDDEDDDDLDDDDYPKDLTVVDRRDIRMDSDSELDETNDDDAVSSKPDSPHQKMTSRRKTMVPTRCAQADDSYVMSDDNSDDRDPDGCKDLSTKDGRKTMQARLDNMLAWQRSEDEKSGSQKNGQENVDSSCDDEINDKSSEQGDENGKDFLSQGGGRETQSNRDLCHQRKDFPKIASLLAGSNQAVDYSTTKRQDDCDDNQSESSFMCHISDQESNMSMSSNESLNHSKSNGCLSPDIDIPIDKENPRKCTICHKIFQNHFGVKSHFQNVHLKLMHNCTVEGCTAAFPSKRSRNRHSANLNLHKKLMSTSDLEDNNHDFGENGDIDMDDECKENINDDGLSDREDEENEIKQEKDYENMNHKNGFYDNGEDADTEEDDNEDSHILSNGSENVLEAEEISFKENGVAVNCHVCQSKFRDNLALKEHFEINHPKEMYHCSVKGCEKIFSTRKSRNRHSQNDNLHRHLVSEKEPHDGVVFEITMPKSAMTPTYS